MADELAVDWDLPLPAVLKVDVAADHIDGLGHVNNLKYIEWCGRSAWLDAGSHGIDLAACQRLDRAMAVWETRVFHLRAAYEGETLLVANWITWADRLRATRRYQIVRTDDQATVLRGYQKFVCIQMSNGRARRMPAEFSSVYQVAPAVAAALATARKLVGE